MSTPSHLSGYNFNDPSSSSYHPASPRDVQTQHLGRGYPAPPPSAQAQARPPGTRSVTGEKRKRAQRAGSDEDDGDDDDEGDGAASGSASARRKVGRRPSRSHETDDGEDDEGGGSVEGALDGQTFETGLSDEEAGGGGSDDDDGGAGGKKRETATGAMVMDKNGRKKIQIKYIEDKSRRHITFSKRKAGIMKKAFELSTLTGTQVLLLVVSETGLVYTFTTSKLQPLVTKPEGKNLIQACLNAPVGEAPGGGPSGPGGMTTGNRSRSSTTPGLPIRHKDDTIEYGPESTPDAGGSAPLGRKGSSSGVSAAPGGGGGSSSRRPRAAAGAKTRKASTATDDAAVATAAGAANGAAPPITGEMLQRREAELQRQREANGATSSGDPSLAQPGQAYYAPLHPLHQGQPSPHGSYSPTPHAHHLTPYPANPSPYPSLSQQQLAYSHPGPPPPTSPAHPGHPQHAHWRAGLLQQQQQPQQPYAPGAGLPPHVQNAPFPPPAAAPHTPDPTHGTGTGGEGGYSAAYLPPASANGQPFASGVQGVEDGGGQGEPQQQQQQQPTQAWPSSLYSS